MHDEHHHHLDSLMLKSLLGPGSMVTLAPHARTTVKSARLSLMCCREKSKSCFTMISSDLSSDFPLRSRITSRSFSPNFFFEMEVTKADGISAAATVIVCESQSKGQSLL